MFMKVVISFLVVLGLTLTGIAAEETVDPVADMVMACTKNISKLVKWPGDKDVSGSDKSLFVAVVGTSDLSAGLKTLNRTSTADGHKLTVRPVEIGMLPANAHVVIICLDDTTAARKVTKKLAGTGTLTIASGDYKIGAVMHFQRDSVKAGKVVCEVSQAAAEAEGIVPQKALALIAKTVE